MMMLMYRVDDGDDDDDGDDGDDVVHLPYHLPQFLRRGHLTIIRSKKVTKLYFFHNANETFSP